MSTHLLFVSETFVFKLEVKHIRVKVLRSKCLTKLYHTPASYLQELITFKYFYAEE
jgi:hypothetical protein